MREFFNVYYPLYIYERHKDYFDLYVYLYSGHPSLSFEYYFSNMSHLENWKNQFQINANKLLVKASNNKIQMPENMRPNEYSYQEENISFNKFNLTRREIQCVQFLLRGLSSKDIAKELLISPRTVETHIVNIKLKTQSRNKYELIYKLKDELL